MHPPHAHSREGRAGNAGLGHDRSRHPRRVSPSRCRNEHQSRHPSDTRARQALWDADLDLALNPESVYSRSARSRIVSCPGRILWYVSDKGKLEGRKTIRACSRIAEICVDKPKALFHRFKRLGVYEWSHVFETAKRDLQNDVMAIRFHDTELLRPISWDVFQEVLQRHKIKTNIESPVRITTKAFEEIYALALHPPTVR